MKAEVSFKGTWMKIKVIPENPGDEAILAIAEYASPSSLGVTHTIEIRLDKTE